MRRYDEIIVEFSSISVDVRMEYLEKIPIDELKVLIDGMRNSTTTHKVVQQNLASYSEYLNVIYNKRISKIRDSKLNDLGI